MEKSTLAIIEQNYSEKDREIILKAFNYAKDAHKDQLRASGEPYFIHPCAVATILINLGMDASTISAAFLHDVIEDTPATAEDIKREFGDEILQLVQGVTKLDMIVFTSQEEEQAENFRKIFVAMAKDIRVIIIKLADRLHNMRSLSFLSKERQQRFAKETLDIYSPLAGRLGISQIKCELDDLCLKYLDPDAYAYLVENVGQMMGERQNFIDEVVAEIKELLAESDIKGEVFGRRKHLYSIYKKMKNQHKTLDQIYDIAAVRVIVGDVDACYEVFGKIHKKWRPVPGRIKDYIATPKKNMYQSLHTTVVTNFGQPFEIQIRTAEMHKTAEYGIAAHWKYKEKGAEDTKLGERLSWIREMMEWQGGFKDSKEFLESFKGDLYSDELLVFTPKGDVLNLAQCSTPIDFAYNIHSAVGEKCVGAKVNGKMVPLNTPLQMGDVVEVITSKNSKGPSWDWLKIVKSSSTKAKIKQFFKREMKEEHIKLGRAMLEREAKKKGYEFTELLTGDSFTLLCNKMSYTSQDEMYASVGCGAVTTNQILFKLIDIYRHEMPVKVQPKFQNVKNETGGVIVKGVSGLLLRFAGCCNPVPGDEIVGFVSRGRGVTVHRKDCPNTLQMDRDRLLPASWAENENTSFFAALKIKAVDRDGVLNDITGLVSSMNLSITSVNGRVDKRNTATIDMTIKLNSKKELDNLMAKLQSDPNVIDVYRTAT